MNSRAEVHRLAAGISARQPGMTAAMARNFSLEAAIASSGDIATYQVYADWLIEQGDPRGDLIALDIAHERDPHRSELSYAREALLRAHADAWLGELAGRRGVECTWQRGFLHAVTLEQTDDTRHASSYAALRGLPTAALLRELTFENDASDAVSWQPAVEALANHGISASLRRLAFGDPRGGYGSGPARLGSFAILYPHAGALEALRITADELELGDIRLRRFACSRSRARGSRMPTWRRWSRQPGRGSKTSRCGSPAKTSEGAISWALSWSLFDDELAEMMLRDPAAFVHLACLDVSDTNVSLAMLKRLRAVLPHVVASWNGRRF